MRTIHELWESFNDREGMGCLLVSTSLLDRSVRVLEWVPEAGYCAREVASLGTYRTERSMLLAAISISEVLRAAWAAGRVEAAA
jgi:hypothetical protein